MAMGAPNQIVATMPEQVDRHRPAGQVGHDHDHHLSGDLAEPDDEQAGPAARDEARDQPAIISSSGERNTACAAQDCVTPWPMQADVGAAEHGQRDHDQDEDERDPVTQDGMATDVQGGSSGVCGSCRAAGRPASPSRTDVPMIPPLRRGVAVAPGQAAHNGAALA